MDSILPAQHPPCAYCSFKWPTTYFVTHHDDKVFCNDECLQDYLSDETFIIEDDND